MNEFEKLLYSNVYLFWQEFFFTFFLKVLFKLMKVWGDQGAIQNTSTGQHAHLTKCILMCLGLLTESQKKSWKQGLVWIFFPIITSTHKLSIKLFKKFKKNNFSTYIISIDLLLFLCIFFLISSIIYHLELIMKLLETVQSHLQNPTAQVNILVFKKLLTLIIVVKRVSKFTKSFYLIIRFRLI